MKIVKLITVNPKMEFAIDYVNTFGNKETFIVPTTGIKVELIPVSTDLEAKIKFYKFQGSLKEVEESAPVAVKSNNNPFDKIVQAPTTPTPAPTQAINQSVEKVPAVAKEDDLKEKPFPTSTDKKKDK